MYYMAILIFALFKSASKKQQVLDEECFTTCTYSYLKPSTMWTFILWIRGDLLSGSSKRRPSKKCFCQLKCCGGWLWMGSGHVGSGVGRGIRGTNHAHGLPHSWTIGTKSKCKEGHFQMETSYCYAFRTLIAQVLVADFLCIQEY